jgi:hypothetical protein
VKLFLVHTMLLVGSIWKNKSGWFLFVMSLWLLVAPENVLTQVLLKTNPAWHQRANETLPCPYNAVCWIHMEEWKWLIPVCYVPVAVGGRKESCWQLGSITDFLTQIEVLMKTNPARHLRANETLPCPYNAVCWIHMEE